MTKASSISILKPLDFNTLFVDFKPEQLAWKHHVNDFFIHDLHDKTVALQLPLPAHQKTVNDFFIVTSGSAKRQVDIHSYDIKDHEMVNVPKLLVSTTDYYSNPIDGFYCHFSDEFLNDTALLLKWQIASNHEHKLVLNPKSLTRIGQLLDTINQLFQEDFTSHKDLIAQYLRTVILEVSIQQQNQQLLLKKNSLVSNYIALIHQNLHQGFRISQAAKLLHVSPNHLNKTVKEQLGRSAQTIYNEIVVQQAKVLLLQTNKDINQIAFDLGFSDGSYFGKFFKKLTEVSPSKYRKMIEKYQ